jgi:hypothetical protein
VFIRPGVQVDGTQSKMIIFMWVAPKIYICHMNSTVFFFRFVSPRKPYRRLRKAAFQLRQKLNSDFIRADLTFQVSDACN